MLDARLTFNSASWRPNMGGQTVYIARYTEHRFIGSKSRISQGFVLKIHLFVSEFGFWSYLC